MDRINKAFLIIESILLFIVFSLLIILPSVHNTLDHLYPENNPKPNSRNGYYNHLTDEIVILRENNTLGYYLTLKHEECHRNQNYQGRLSVGSKEIFWDEIECNIKRWAGVIDYINLEVRNGY